MEVGVEEDRQLAGDQAMGAQLTPAAHRVLGGGAALLMLRAIGGLPCIDLPMQDFVEAVAQSVLDPAVVAREAALRPFEHRMTLMPNVFAREEVACSPVQRPALERLAAVAPRVNEGPLTLPKYP